MSSLLSRAKVKLKNAQNDYIHLGEDDAYMDDRLLMNNYLINRGFEKVKAVSFSKTIDEDRYTYDHALQLGDNLQTD